MDQQINNEMLSCKLSLEWSGMDFYFKQSGEDLSEDVSNKRNKRLEILYEIYSKKRSILIN